MAKYPPLSKEEEEKSPSPTPSSSLRFSSKDDDGQSIGVPTGRKRGKTFDEITKEVIRDMQREEKGGEGQVPRGETEEGGPSQPVLRVNDENPYEGLTKVMIDLTGTDDEADAEEDEWRRSIEERVDALEAKVEAVVAEVDALVAEMTEQHAQMTRLVSLVERVVS